MMPETDDSCVFLDGGGVKENMKEMCSSNESLINVWNQNKKIFTLMFYSLTDTYKPDKQKI